MRYLLTALTLLLSFVLPLEVQAQTAVYSYRNGGEWTDPASWTTDPTGQTLQPAGGAGVPIDNAVVRITTGSHIYLTQAVDKQNLSIEIEEGAELDLAEFTFQYPLAHLKGQGVLSIVSDTFPIVNGSSSFLDAAGGTVRFAVPTTSLVKLRNLPHSFCNLTFAGRAEYAYSLRFETRELLIHKNLTLEEEATLLLGGIPNEPELHDLAAFLRKKLWVKGNLTVKPQAALRVIEGKLSTAQDPSFPNSTTDPFFFPENKGHILELGGKLSNEGVIRLHNLNDIDFARPSTFRNTVVVLASGATSVQWECAGQTDLYRLFLRKEGGAILTLNATQSDNFILWAGNRDSKIRALNLLAGTLRLTGKTAIASLAEEGHYTLPQGTTLQLDSPDALLVFKAQNAAQVADIYRLAPVNIRGVNENPTVSTSAFLHLDGGTLHIKQGTVALGDGAILTSGDHHLGQLLIEGGQLFAPQLVSTDKRFAYKQTGGLVVLRGQRKDIQVNTATSTRNPARAYGAMLDATPAAREAGTFVLINNSDRFEHTGGELRLVGGVYRGATQPPYLMHVNVSDGAHTPTGTLRFDLSGLTAPERFLIQSTATLGDVTLQAQSATQEFALVVNLKVRGNLTLSRGVLNLSGKTLTLCKDFTLGGTLETQRDGNATLLFRPQGVHTFKMLTGASITGNALHTLQLSEQATGVTGKLSMDLPLSLSCQNFFVRRGIDCHLAQANTKVVVNKEFHLESNITGGSVELENGVSIPQGYGTVDHLLLRPNAQVAALDGFSVAKRLTLAPQSELYLMQRARLKFLAGATLELRGDASGAVRVDGTATDGGIEKRYGAGDASSDFVFPFVVADGHGQRIARRLTIAGPKDLVKRDAIALSVVNAQHPSLRLALPFYIRETYNANYEGLTLSVDCHTPPPPTYQPIYFAQGQFADQWTPRGTLAGTVATFDMWRKGDYVVGTPYQSAHFTSVKNGAWNDPTTWDLQRIPDLGDEVDILHHVFVPQAMPQARCGVLHIHTNASLDLARMSETSIAQLHGEAGALLRIALDPDDASHNRFAATIDASPFVGTSATVVNYYMLPTAVAKQVLIPEVFNQYEALRFTYTAQDQVFVLNPEVPSLVVRNTLTLVNPDAHTGAMLSFGGVHSPVYGAVALKVYGAFDAQNASLAFAALTATPNLHILTCKSLARFVGANGVKFPTLPDVKTGRVAEIGFEGDLVDNTPAGLRFVEGNRSAMVYFRAQGTATVSGAHPIRFDECEVNLADNQAQLHINNAGLFQSSLTDDWLTLTRGEVHLNAAGTLSVSKTRAFQINTNTLLHLNHEGLTVRIAEEGVTIPASPAENYALELRGSLRISKGKLIVGAPNLPAGRTADFQYYVSSDTRLELRGGRCETYGHFRGALGYSNCNISYIQSGGEFFVAAPNVPTEKPGLDITGKEFQMTGGELVYAGAGAPESVGDVVINAQTSTISGGTIRLTGSEATPRSLSMVSNTPLYNLSCEGTNLQVRVLRQAFSVRNQLHIAATSTFTADGLNLFLGGELLCNGRFFAKNNQTTFDGTTLQRLSGTGAQCDFHNLQISNPQGLEVTLPVEVTIAGNLTIDKRSTQDTHLTLGAKRWKLAGILQNDGGYATTAPAALQLVGTTLESQLRGSGKYGSLEIANPAGARTEEDMHLRGVLSLVAGSLSIGRHLLRVERGGTITGASETRYIATDASLPRGIVYELSQGDTHVLFPLGTGTTYTPATLTFDGGYPAAMGNVRIANVAERFNIVDECAQKVLNFHWEVESNLQAATGSLSFSCPLSYKASNMTLNSSAPVRFQSGVWAQQSKNQLSETAGMFNLRWTFRNTGLLAGRYTAGDPFCFLRITEVESVTSGDWTDDIWKPYGVIGAQVVSLPDGPQGMTVHINPFHTVTLAKNDVEIKGLIFEKPKPHQQEGTLSIDPAAQNVNLGEVKGFGALEIKKGTLPSGNYDHFFGCNNFGRLILAGVSDYEFGGHASHEYPYLHLTGSGKRRMPNVNIRVCKVLSIEENAVYDNTLYNRGLNINGKILRQTTAGFLSGTGWVSLEGNEPQELGGADADFSAPNSFHGLIIQNEKGVTLKEGGNVFLTGALRLLDGKLHTPRSQTTGKFTIQVASSNLFDANQIGNSTSYVDGPLWLHFTTNVGAYRCPVGLKSRLANFLFLRDVQPGTVCVEAVENPAPQFQLPLKHVDATVAWKLSASATTMAKISLLKNAFVWSGGQREDELNVVYKRGSMAWDALDSKSEHNPKEIVTENAQNILAGSTLYTLGVREHIKATVTFLHPNLKYCAKEGETLRIPIKIQSSKPLNDAEYYNLWIDYKVGTKNYTLTIVERGTQLVHEPFYIEVKYDDIAPSGEETLVQITGFKSKRWYQVVGQEQLWDKTKIPVRRSPFIKFHGTEEQQYNVCFSEKSFVRLVAAATPSGSVSWRSEGAHGSFSNRNSLTTDFTLLETGRVRLFVKVDNNGCATESEAPLRETLPLVEWLTGTKRLCAPNGIPVTIPYNFNPRYPERNPGYTWSLRQLPANSASQIVMGTEHRASCQVEWSATPPYPGATHYDAVVHLEITDKHNCFSQLDYPVRVILQIRTAPVYYVPALP